MVHGGMIEYETYTGPVLRTKDFRAKTKNGSWYIAPNRDPEMLYTTTGELRLGGEDAAQRWLMHEPMSGALHEQFWSYERKRYEAADEDEAYALLIHLQKTFSSRLLN